MFYSIQYIAAKIITGYQCTMNLLNDSQLTPPLFRQFMAKKSLITHRVDNTTLCVKIFSAIPDFNDPQTTYLKWAACEVSQAGDGPQFESHTIAAGLYAIFIHQGRADDLSTFDYIFNHWLANSDYHLDQREHFEIMPENYQPLDDNANEWIYIPIKAK